MRPTPTLLYRSIKKNILAYKTTLILYMCIKKGYSSMKRSHILVKNNIKKLAEAKKFLFLYIPRKKNIIIGYKKALRWVKDKGIFEQGIIVSSRQRVPYLEVTGYFIPTLYQLGEKEIARDLTYLLIKHQNCDGSFSAPDGTPYTFDTGQVIRGFVAALADLTEVEQPLRRACDWILTQVQQDGRLNTPSTDMWGDVVDDRIHLYVLPSLLEAGKKLNEQKYIDASNKVLQYYKLKTDLVEFDTLSHFCTYVIEALCDLGEVELARLGIEKISKFQNKDGSVPAYTSTTWVCSTGVAQFAVICYKLGLREPADRAMSYLLKIQNPSGGFYGSYGKGAEYFPREEISWAVKFFLDAYYWKVKSADKQNNYKPMLQSIDDK